MIGDPWRCRSRGAGSALDQEVGVFVSNRLLVELAGPRLGNLVDEDDAIREPPLGHVMAQVSTRSSSDIDSPGRATTKVTGRSCHLAWLHVHRRSSLPGHRTVRIWRRAHWRFPSRNRRVAFV